MAELRAHRRCRSGPSLAELDGPAPPSSYAQVPPWVAHACAFWCRYSRRAHAPGADPEALEVAKDCLESIFSIDSSATAQGIQPGLLLELFSSLEANGRDKPSAGLVSQSVSNKPSPSASTSNIEEDSNKCASNRDSPVEDTFDLDHSGDELFAKYYAALHGISFFKTSPAGAEDPGQLSKATQYFTEALLVMDL